MSANVGLPLPLLRLPPWFPGQMGVPGTDVRTGLRTHPTGTVFYVDPNQPGASDLRDGTDPDNALRTVTAALTKCRAFRGDTIIVGANDNWLYGAHTSDYLTVIQEAVVVMVPGVRIIGASPSSSAGVVWTPPATGGPCVTVHALDTLIEGFAFCGGLIGGTGILAEWNGTTQFGDNLCVRHCLFDQDIDTGIQLEFVWNAEIRNCAFHECDAYGIYVAAAGAGISLCKIVGNWFHDCGTSNLFLDGATKCMVAVNLVYSAHAQAAAPAADELIRTAGAGGGENIVTDNMLSCKLPVPANGDYNDACSASATDAWIGNQCMNGSSLTNPT